MGPAGSAESPPAAEKHSWRRTAVMAVAAAIFAAVWGRGGPIFAALAVLCMLPVLLKIEEEWEPVAPGMQAQQKLQDQVAAALGTDSRASTPGKAGASGQALKSMGTVYFGTQRGQSRRFAEALVTSAAQAGLHLKLADMTCASQPLRAHNFVQLPPPPFARRPLLPSALVSPQVRRPGGYPSRRPARNLRPLHVRRRHAARGRRLVLQMDRRGGRR